MKHKALAMVLALCMVLSMLPMNVFAVQPQKAPQSGMISPSAVETLPTAAVTPNARSYSVSLTSSGKGETELLVSSPAQAGSEVYFMANPDDGYLAEVYVDGIDPEEVFYLGADMWGFIMPGNKVTLEVKFVAAEGEEHQISLCSADGGGRSQLSRNSAKAGESVLLAVLPEHDYDFEPTELVWAFGADLYYLFEQDGIHYYEIFMGDEDVTIILCYNVRGAHKITKDFWGGKLELESNYATTNKEVVFTVTPPVGDILDDVEVITDKGGISLDLTYLGEEQGKYTYSFIMPPCSVKVKLLSHTEIWNITVNHNSGGTAFTDYASTGAGKQVMLTVLPDEGYRVESITGIDGLTDNGYGIYTFTMPARDVTIDVTFAPIYNPITVTVETGLGGSAITNVLEAKAGDTVTLTATPEEGYRVAQITGVSNLTDNGDNTYTFTMPDKAVELKVLFLRNENPFLDVNETQFFYDSVLWAVENSITTGISADAFDPFAECNRAQVVTFLWRYAGSPEPTVTSHPFEDVAANSFYEKAVLWALENGITTGISATEFGANLPCNRAQVVTFLWRMMKQPTPSLTEHPFTDVAAKSFYEQPVLWALENGITTGSSATAFNPDGKCQRAQVVTFLYRTAQLAPAVHAVSAQFDPAMGTVTLSHEEAAAGEVITATVVPAEGYLLDWIQCESGAEITVVSETEFTFVMPDQEEVFYAGFAPIETEPTEPVETYELVLKDNGHGTVTHVDATSAAPGESIFFYAVPEEGYFLERVGIFNPDNAIDVSQIRLYEHEDNLYELVMINHDIIMTLYFSPIG